VRELFGDRVESLSLSRSKYVESAASSVAYTELFGETFGPMIALRGFLSDQPDRRAAFDRDFMEFATRASRGASGGPAKYAYEYLLVVARRGAGHEPD
jgi:hypothetical protein